MQIRGVFFDMGGTIETFDQTPEIQREATPGLQALLAEKGLDPGYSLEDLFLIISSGLDRYHRWNRVTKLELPAWQVWRDYLLPDCSLDPQILSTAAEDLMFYIETHYYRRALRPEVPAVLAEIRRMRYQIGLISNVNSRRQVPANLETYGIKEYFDPIVLSCEYGRRKPDPAIFLHAARLAQLPASACMYIGDRIARDVLGAKEAGFKLAVQILHDYQHGEQDEGAIPDAVISSMSEVLDLLRDDAWKPDPTAVLRAGGGPCAVLFDAGDILYHRPRRNAAFEPFLDRLGLKPDDLDEQARREYELQAYQGRITQDQYREAVIRCYGITDPKLVEEGSQIIKAEDNDLDIFEGVPETLRALKQKGFMLGIITDTAASISNKLEWFKAGGFGDVWDTIISSVEIGVRKPHPLIYQAALTQLGINVDQAVFVGHKPGELEGARKIGMTTIAFNHDPGAVADFYIHHFSELTGLMVLQPGNQKLLKGKE